MITVATRGSKLATNQTNLVISQLSAVVPAEARLGFTSKIISTKGDQSSAPIAQLGGTGVFVSALREALLADEAELAVHSLKDLPTTEVPGLRSYILPRGSALDAFCSARFNSLAELPIGAKVGTGSPRRAAQLLRIRPDLEVVGLRGNVDSRLRQAGFFADAGGAVAGGLAAVILAVAGLERIGFPEAITQALSVQEMMPAPGQGALVIEVSEDALLKNPQLVTILEAVEDLPTRWATIAERTVLRELEAGCSAPVASFGEFATEDTLRISAAVFGQEPAKSGIAEGAIGEGGVSEVKITQCGVSEVGITQGGVSEVGITQGEIAEISGTIEFPVTSDAQAVAAGQKLASQLLANGAKELIGLGN